MSLLKRLIMLIVIMAALVAGFYYFMKQQASNRLTSPQTGKQSSLSQELTGNTTLEGVVSFADGRYFLKDSNNDLSEVDSLQLSLQPYIGNQVKVTGQYSGDTLMISKIEVMD